MSEQEDERIPLRALGPPTTDEQDALLDIVDALPPASGDHGNGAQDLARATARRIAAVRMRMGRATYEQIAEACGYTDRGTARKVVVRALQKIEAESVQELRILENTALDADEMVLRTIISTPTAPAGDRIRAIDSRLRLSARRSRLNGLDAPIQVALSAGVAADLQDALAEAESVFGEVLYTEDERLEG